MITHCSIGIKNEDGTVTAIYCHTDGNPGSVGKILKENYAEESTARDLIYGGDIAILGENEDFTVRYEDGPEDYAHDYNTTREWLGLAGQQYNYIFHENEWWVNRNLELDQDKAYPIFTDIDYAIYVDEAEGVC